MRRREE